ncbi:MAG TPA: hydroxyisourate hydrolase [Pseudonocardiaceae bacterium]|jgi:hydroxyisourate hydrolase|nr:hydroxyisourate hydrolase [Pseudonocardiaceae bacterium]
MSAITTHVLDTAAGSPAAGVAVRLETLAGNEWRPIAAAVTDTDGRVRDLGPEEIAAATYRLIFDTTSYFARRPHFYPEITVTFVVADPTQHYHVPILLSPFGFSTYRGS